MTEDLRTSIIIEAPKGGLVGDAIYLDSFLVLVRQRISWMAAALAKGPAILEKCKAKEPEIVRLIIC